MNASPIRFDGCNQRFIASQSPKENCINQFWHMVIQENVSVIIMITCLLEGKWRKAHQYWPDEEIPVLYIGGGFKVEHVTTLDGTFFLRKFSISSPDGKSREVVQLQIKDWPDLGEPEGPK